MRDVLDPGMLKTRPGIEPTTSAHPVAGLQELLRRQARQRKKGHVLGKRGTL